MTIYTCPCGFETEFLSVCVIHTQFCLASPDRSGVRGIISLAQDCSEVDEGRVGLDVVVGPGGGPKMALGPTSRE